MVSKILTINITNQNFDLFLIETSEDISPYATFQLSEASTLAQPHHQGPANTLLHSFMYHERAMTEGCASPPPAAVLRQLHNKSPYYNIVRFSFKPNWQMRFLISKFFPPSFFIIKFSCVLCKGYMSCVV